MQLSVNQCNILRFKSLPKMRYPIGPESLAKFYKVRVSLSDKVVREFRQKFPQNKPKPSKTIYDINCINSNGLIPLVIIERPNAADRALEALQRGSMNKSSAQKSTTNKSKRTNKKPMKANPTNAKKPSQKKQKPSRPLFVLPKWNKLEQSKKNPTEHQLKSN